MNMKAILITLVFVLSPSYAWYGQNNALQKESEFVPEDDPEVVWGEEGESVELPLAILPGNKVNMILWFKDSTGIPFYSVDGRGGDLSKAAHGAITDDLGGRSFFTMTPPRLRITKVTSKDQGVFRARVDYMDHPTVNYRINLTLITAPSGMQIVDEDGNEMKGMVGPYLEGTNLRFTCIVTPGMPRPKVSWWLEDEEIDDVSESIGPRTIINRVQLPRLSRTLQGKKLSCIARPTELSHPTNVTLILQLYLRPESVNIVSRGEVLQAGKSKQLLCQSHGSYPAANITWLIDSEPIRLAATMVGVSKNETTTSILSLRPQWEDDGKELSCTAHHPMFPGFELTDSIYLKVTYPPVATVRMDQPGREGVALTEGDNVTLICNIKANPSPDLILWYHEGQLISKNESGSVLTVYKVSPSSAGLYSCFVRNSQGASRSPPYALHINYAPVCREGWAWREVGAKVGREVTAECRVDAVPARDIKFSWTLSRAMEVVPMTASVSHSTASLLSFIPQSNDDLGTLSCWATNPIGRQTSPCITRLTPAKAPDPPSDCEVETRPGEGIEVRCQPGPDGGLAQQFMVEVRSLMSESRPDHPSDEPGPLFTLYSPRPAFTLTNLSPASSYQLTLYAKNSIGISNPPVVISAVTAALPLHSRAYKEDGSEDLIALNGGVRWWWWWWVGALLAFVLLITITVFFVCMRGKPSQPEVPLNNLQTVRHQPITAHS